MARKNDELRDIPGIGPAMAEVLRTLGIASQNDLRGKDPEVLYRRYETLAGKPVDRCVLYTFRCAVYYCDTPKPDPELLKWWNWKDKA